jgi:fluoride exporter
VPTALAIAVAGALGALTRWGADWALGRHEGAFPLDTTLVNLTGSFLLGLAVAALPEEPGWLRPAVAVGFLGAYTTFSTFSLEAWRLFEEGAAATSLAYMTLSVAGGLVLAWLGLLAGRAL